ncbi:MAG TPA: tetratricopeptide repeat protein [Rudaea sp.]|jgi:TolB-like protein|nr:tetratricopeptide repeat protein [Rudaea sp.]
MNFLAELKRRNVLRTAGLYLVAAWLIVQVTGTLLPMFGAPEWLPRSVVVLLAVGLLPVLVFAWVYELTPEGLKLEREVERDESITRDTGQRMNRAIFVLLVLAIGCFVLDRFVLTPRRESATAQSGPAESKPGGAVPDNSIAVLPLANASGDKDQQYFSDGLSEGLIVTLSRLQGLKVIGRNSAFQFRDSKDDSKTIGLKLGVAHLLEGSVQHAGDVVRISAELINAADGSTLWSERYDRPYRDLFTLQDEITNAVASALKAKLLPQANAPMQSDRPPSGNLDAYAAYLQGKFFFARSGEADFRKAIEQYARATQVDPGYALAWAGQSRSAASLAAAFLDGAAAQDMYATARRAVDAALKLDPDLAAAHAAKSFLLLSADLDWTGAEQAARRAVQLEPNDSQGKADLSRDLAALGQIEPAIALMQQSLATDPLDARSHNWLAQYLRALGRLDEAATAARKAIELQPTAGSMHYQLAIIEIGRGDAKAALEAAQNETAGWQVDAVALARQVGGNPAEADAALKTQVEQDAEGGAFQIAQTYALRNDADKTFEWLDRALSNRDPGISYLLFDPFILRFRDDPRFAAFCKKVGLPTTTTAKAMAVPAGKANKT